MMFESINPADGKRFATTQAWDESQLAASLQAASAAGPAWRSTSMAERCRLMRAAAQVLRERQDSFAALITREMGKLIGEARNEVAKCATVCDYYAEHGPAFLADEPIASDAGRSLVAYPPLGAVLAVMPWNFPFWQVMRFAAPALVAGNTALLKHASNVPQCALALQEMFAAAGFPAGVFTSLMIPSAAVAEVIASEHVQAVTLTGSEPAGKAVAQCAGYNLKKTVLELGGSDPFIVLDDADLDQAVSTAVASRYLNCGQSCIAAKRFIVVESIAEAFLARFKTAVEQLRPGDPQAEDSTLAPMARADLRDELHQQVRDSIRAGAVALTGCEIPAGAGAYYAPSILDRVVPGVRAYEEELFGPVAVVIHAADEQAAVDIANDSRFGLGGSVWTRDAGRGERVARAVESGAVFVNGLVKSDPRLPFGGIKASGYGRELSRHGIREFVNAKTIWIQ